MTDEQDQINELTQQVVRSNEQIVNMTNEYQDLLATAKTLRAEIDRFGLCERCTKRRAVHYLLIADVPALLCNPCRFDFTIWMIANKNFALFRSHTIRHQAAIQRGHDITAVSYFNRQLKMHRTFANEIATWIHTPPESENGNAD